MPLTLQAPTPQNAQTPSNNSSAVADKLLNVFDHFVGMARKGSVPFTVTD